MGEDVISFADDFCCCRMFFIQHGIYLITFHCFLQAAYGCGVVVTSSYKTTNSVVNFITISSNLCLIPTGILLFWANINNSWKGARVCAFFIVIVTLFNIVTSIIYFVTYVNFRANSLMDVTLFRGGQAWADSEELPLTIWHILGFVLIVINFLWFYYTYMTCKLANHLKHRSV